MQKRVLAFLLVMVMVLSLLPVSLVGADTETATPAYTMSIQKAHNQTEGSLAIDIYLQATVASEVTGYQLKVTPAEGLTLTGVADNTGNDNLKASGETIVYDPAGLKPITMGTARVLVATVTVTGETLPAQAGDAITVTEAQVTTAEAQFAPTVTAVAVNDAWADVTGQWKPLTQADMDAASNVLTSGNYYLVEDITTTKQLIQCSDVNLDLNGYTLAASGKLDLIKAVDGKFLTINDCTATGSALDGTLKAGTLVAGNSSYGGGLYAGQAATLKVSNVNLDGSALVGTDSGNLLYALGKTNKAAAGKLIANNVNIFGGKADPAAKNPVVMGDARGDIELTDVRFSGMDLTPNADAAGTKGNAILSARHSANYGNLVLDNVIAENCNNYAVYMMNSNNNKFASVTIKGDTQLADPIYMASGTKLILDLGANASIIIETEKTLTEEEFGSVVTFAEGATLPAGTLLYKNAEMMVDYKDGVFSFAGHAHKAETFANGTEEGHTVEGMSFKAWGDSANLPTSGNYYLTTDVTLSARPTIANGKVLNLDLNGHTVSQTKATTAIFEVSGGGTLNLFDCQGGYDAEGKWIGGKLTGGTGGSGGAVLLQPGVAGTEKRAVFNMYGGSISGNHTASSGGAVYVGYSKAENGKNRPGAQFNMYGGEIANNISNAWGAAITAMGYSPTATSGNKGVDPALNLGAQINIHGGKIYGNVTKKATDSTGYGEGTIHLAYDAIMTMTGGEIFNNEAELGGAVFLGNTSSKAIITGGKIYGNTAVEDTYKRSQFKLTTNTKDQVTSHTVYMGKGGAFYVYGGTLEVKNVEITDNFSTLGGAFYLANGTRATVENCLIDGNTAYDARTAKFDESKKNTSGNAYTAHNQEWGNGGAAYVYSSSTTATFKNCQITNNVANEAAASSLSSYSGCTGGIYAAYVKNLVLDGCTFDGNISTKKCGGALNLRNDGTTADVRNCVFTNNVTGNAGGAIYTVNSAVLKLTDTLIYGNNSTGNNLGCGIYITSQGGRIILSGKVVIDNNTYKGAVSYKSDLAFQNQTGRKYLAEIDELGAGSSIDLYFDTNATSTIITEDKPEGYVKLAPDATQSDWDCGWITVTSKKNTTGRQMAYIDLTDDGVDNKTFEWGHYHKKADGTYYALTAWTDATQLPDKPAADGSGYYLTKDVTIGAAGKRAEYRPGSHVAEGYDYELCFNGHDVTVPDTVLDAAIVLRSVNGWIGDCGASFDENGHLISGGAINGAHKKENGGGIYITDDDGIGTNVTIYGIELNGCYETTQRDGLASPGYAGGGIHARNKSGSVDKTDVTIIGCKFTGNHTAMEGGAINSLNGADFTITDTVFENNYAGRFGGAISMVGASGAKGELKLDNCRFIGNYATTNPTNWTDKADTTDVNEAITPIKGTGIGGAIYATYTKVDVKDCYFEGNRAYNAEKLTNITWTSDVGIGQGGAIYLTSSATVDVEGSTFVDNYAAYQAGAIYYYGGTNHITSSVFEGNIGEQYGGALFTLNSGAVLHITGTADAPSVFRNNQALGYTYTKADGTKATANGRGGAIECMNGTTSLTYCEFYDNTSRYEGGAVRLGGGGGTTKVYSLDNCYFEGNESTAGAGGGLYIHAVTKEAVLNNTDFVGNIAQSQGGGMYLKGSTVKSGDKVVSVPNITINGGTFEDNKAGTHSGALHVAQNTTLTANGVTFKNNEANNGGAITSGESGSIVNCNNCLFTGNKAKTAEGGAALHLWYKTVNYSGCTFEGNTAATNGGAISIKGNDNAVATIGGAGDAACTFTGNTAKSAGAVWGGSTTHDVTVDGVKQTVNYKPTTNIINSTFTGNTATNDVAAVKSCNGHQMTITDSTITGNTSKNYGALHVATSNASLTLAGKVIVTGNVSTAYAEFAENTDLYFQNYTEVADLQAKVDISGLTEGSSIGVYASDGRVADDNVLTKNGGAAAAGYLFADCDRIILGTKDNEVIAGKYLATDGTLYATVQAAIEAAEASGENAIKLQASTSEELKLTTLDYIDLNGKDVAKVTVPEGKTLDIVDTTTDDYDCSEGFGEIVVEGKYNAYVEDTSSGSLKRYVVIADEEGKLSAHRIYLAITSKTLRPSNAGVGFKAIFAGDEVVAENVVYGIQLSGYADFSQVLAASFDTMEAGAMTNTPNQKTVVIYNAIDKDNTSRWDADMYGRPFITIGDTTVYGKDVTVNMKSMAANALASGDATVVAAVNEMMTNCGVSAN